MTRLVESPARQIGMGLAIAAFAQLLGMFLAGAGHGWVTPLFASFLLWVMTPFAVMYALPRHGAGWPILLPMLLVALLANGWLISSTIEEQHRLAYYLKYNGILGYLFVALWIAAWLFWQGVVVTSLFARRVQQ